MNQYADFGPKIDGEGLLDEVVPKVFTKYGGLEAGFLLNSATPAVAQRKINKPVPYFVKSSGRIS